MATTARNRRLEPSYKQHGVVDDLRGVVLDVEITTGETNEGQVILERLDAAGRQRRVGIATVTADAGYAYAKVFAGLEAREITGVIPTKAEPIRSKVPLRRFRYDAKHDHREMPEGKILRPEQARRLRMGGSSPRRSRDCRGCDLAAICLSPSRATKSLVIVHDYPALLRARRRRERWGETEDDRLYQRHRWRSEGFHGEAKTWHGLAQRRATRAREHAHPGLPDRRGDQPEAARRSLPRRLDRDAEGHRRCDRHSARAATSDVRGSSRLLIDGGFFNSPTVQRWIGSSAPHSAVIAASNPGAPSTITKSGRLSPRASRSSRNWRQAAVLSPPMCLMDNRIFCPSRRTPMAASTEMLVAFLSSRVRITVPSRIRRTMSSSARLRAHQASQSDLHLAPGPADHILADRAPEQPEQRPLDPPRVGPGEVDRGDQGLGPLRQPLIAAQRLRPPFGGLAVLALDAGARHADGLGAEGADRLALATAVAIALPRAAAAAIADAAENAGELLLEQRLDGRAHRRAQPLLNRVATRASPASGAAIAVSVVLVMA